ncbi:MAG: hypothetical protein NC132_07060 [Corallococcus sp.]|nr:hypothetical protein [Corallococcus sp.]MCM1395844.1 hypothetical protein [Corallococcus sp.]
MKRKIALVVTALLLLTLSLAACNQVVATDIVTRWGDEEYTFNISLADFNENVTSAFNVYENNGASYYKDFVIQTSAAREYLATEEVRPDDVKGLYTLSLKRDGAYCTLTTSQVIYARYKTAELQASENWDDLQTCVASIDPFAADETLTTLVSRNDTKVTFSNDPTQKPVSSSVKVDGFYFGHKAQNVSKYEIVTEYDIENKTAKVTKDGKEPQVNKLTIANASKFIDANQVIIYARSLEKSAAFQDTPSVVVYNPLDNTNYTATFYLSVNQNAVLTVNGNNEYLQINTLGISLGNQAFMMQETLPKLDKFDTYPNSTNPDSPHSKYTMVNFRVGYLSYEISDDFYSAELIQAIKDRASATK